MTEACQRTGWELINELLLLKGGKDVCARSDDLHFGTENTVNGSRSELRRSKGGKAKIYSKKLRYFKGRR